MFSDFSMKEKKKLEPVCGRRRRRGREGHKLDWIERGLKGINKTWIVNTGQKRNSSR